MKIIGLIGGMSWESTIPYYKIINEEIKTKLGGLLGTTNLGAYFISTTSSHYDWALKKLKAHRKIVASK